MGDTTLVMKNVFTSRNYFRVNGLLCEFAIYRISDNQNISMYPKIPYKICVRESLS